MLKFNLNHLHYTDKIFRIGKYEKKIKFGSTTMGSPSHEDAKIQTF